MQAPAPAPRQTIRSSAATAGSGDCSMRTPSSGPASIVRVKVLPLPNSLATSISPPSALARRLEMAKPRPVPP